MEPSKATSVNSRAEELFVQLFCEAFGPEKTENLQVQYPCVDIYGRHRYIDFALESPESKIAIEIDGETYHNPSKVSENKYADDLLKQNSLIYDNWKVYRWIYIACVFIGPYMTVKAVWTIADIFNGLMAIPNLIALLALNGVVVAETKKYLDNAKKKF